MMQVLTHLQFMLYGIMNPILFERNFSFKNFNFNDIKDNKNMFLF